MKLTITIPAGIAAGKNDAQISFLKADNKIHQCEMLYLKPARELNLQAGCTVCCLPDRKLWVVVVVIRTRHDKICGHD